MSKINRIQTETIKTEEKEKSWVASILEKSKKIILNVLDIRNMEEFIKLEKENKWITLNYETILNIFQKYPHLDIEEFKKYFFWWFNKNILQCSPWILDYIDLEKLSPGDDIIEHVLGKLTMTEEEFKSKTDWKLDFLTFPNLSQWSISQLYFYNKLSQSIPWTEIIFWDNPKIREVIWKNQLNTDSVWFIDPLWKWIFNICLFKLLKTNPDEQKLRELDELFDEVSKDIFIWWSSTHIPFDIPSTLEWISFPKVISAWEWIKKVNNLMVNSMGYLNSAYYTKKSKAAFVQGTHNIAEPLHAWKLTVISDDPKNRYNHNWLISYFWEKAQLLKITEWNKESQQREFDTFMETSQEELALRHKKFAETYKIQIKPLVNWIFYNYLKNSFPEKFK